MFQKTTHCLLVGLMVFLLLSVGCGNGSGTPDSATPSIDDVQAKISNDIANQGEGSFKVLSVRKRDGQASEIQGVKMYTLEFVATVEFSTACTYKTEGGIEIVKSTNTNIDDSSKMHAKTGERALVLGDLKFEMKESGWNIMNVKYKAMVPDLDSMKVLEDKAEYKYTP